jgi:hypothetical protein
MIIGTGDIARILNDREGVIFFASGVSNSSEKDEQQFARERSLLLQQDTSKCIFYFSSISVEDVDKLSTNRYLKHKLEMEALIKTNFQNYNIIRIGNITWGVNPNTFLNFLRNKLKNNEEVIIKDEYKFVIDKEQLVLLTDNLPTVGQNQISVFGKMGKVKDLI